MNTKHELYKNYIHVHAKARRQFWVVFLEYIYLVLETGTFNNLELTMAGYWAMGSAWFSLSRAGIANAYQHAQLFTWILESNSGRNACTETFTN